jgi:DNA-binding transcriptional ArsR family regulator
MISARRDVFQAIADPTRRELIKFISRQPLSVNDLASNFGISRPAVSQQLKILEECGLLIFRQEGRERICEPKFEKLKEVSAWLDHYRKFWTKKLTALENFLELEEIKQKQIIKKQKHGKK